jgi:hypothetical protein
MGLILLEPIKNVVKISKILAKTSVEAAETHQEAKTIDGKGRRSRQKEVGEKTKRKRKVRPRAKTWEEKRCFGWGLCFSCLAYKQAQHRTSMRLTRSRDNAAAIFV